MIFGIGQVRKGYVRAIGEIMTRIRKLLACLSF